MKIILLIIVLMTIGETSGYNEIDKIGADYYVLCGYSSNEGVCQKEEIKSRIIEDTFMIVSLSNASEAYLIYPGGIDMRVRDFMIYEGVIWILTKDGRGSGYIMAYDMEDKNMTMIKSLRPQVGGTDIEVTEYRIVTYWENGSGKYIEKYNKTEHGIEYVETVEILPGKSDMPIKAIYDSNDGFLWSMHVGREIRSSYGRSTMEDDIFYKINVSDGHRVGEIKSDDHAPVEDYGRVEDFKVETDGIGMILADGYTHVIDIKYTTTTENMNSEQLIYTIVILVIIRKVKITSLHNKNGMKRYV